MDFEGLIEKIEITPGSVNIIFLDDDMIDFKELFNTIPEDWSPTTEILLIPCRKGAPTQLCLNSIEKIEKFLIAVKSKSESENVNERV